MTLINDNYYRGVTGLNPQELNDIKNFLQGAVYSWCKNRKEEWFSLSNLMGGDNFFWEGTPMMALFMKHKNKGKNDKSSIKGAGVDGGWILKEVLRVDKRSFESKLEFKSRFYKWVP